MAVTLAPVLFAAGQWTAAADVVAAADEMLGDRDPAASAELAGIGLLITGYSLALVDRVPITPERLEELSAGEGWTVHALAAMRAAYAVHTGDAAKARELVDRALEGGTLLAERERGIWATSHLLVAMAELDDNERGVAVATEIEAAAEREGSMNSHIAAVSHRSWIQARQGDLAGAVDSLGAADQGGDGDREPDVRGRPALLPPGRAAGAERRRRPERPSPERWTWTPWAWRAPGWARWC